jgi:hypothetical protein
MVAGAVLLLVHVLVESGLSRLVEGILYLGALCLLLLGFVLWVRRKHEFDERFQLHRLKATRLAAVTGMVLLGVWFVFDAFVNDVIHWQIMVILVAMAGAKVGSMVYFQRCR